MHHIISISKQLYEKATAATARFTSLRSDSYKPPEDLVTPERAIRGTLQFLVVNGVSTQKFDENTMNEIW